MNTIPTYIQRLMPKTGECPKKWARRVSAKLKVLSLDNAKLVKGGEIQAALMFAPGDLSGYEVCKHSCAGCRAVCVAHAGNGRFATVLDKRISRTQLFFRARADFAAALADDFALLNALGQAMECNVYLRPNAFSDLPWEKIKLYADGSTLVDQARRFGITLYDYTKNKARALAQPYYLTYSRTATDTDGEVAAMIAAGVNVAVSFRGTKPATFAGVAVHDGDLDDRRYLDPRGVIVGLKAKGAFTRATDGFIVMQ